MRARGIVKCSLPELCDRMTGHASLYASAFLPPPSGYKFGPRNRCTIQSTPEDLFEICSQFSLILIIRAEKKPLRCRTTVSAKTFEINRPSTLSQSLSHSSHLHVHLSNRTCLAKEVPAADIVPAAVAAVETARLQVVGVVAVSVAHEGRVARALRLGLRGHSAAEPVVEIAVLIIIAISGC